jgi:hypothetical protein
MISTKRLLGFALLTATVLSPISLSASLDRFKGGTYDGYAQNALYQLAAPDYELITARFRGASHDGYAKSILEDTPVFVSGGTILTIR